MRAAGSSTRRSGKGDIGADWSDRPYFARFKADATLKFDFGAAARRGGAGAAAGEWFIPVVHGWRRPNGEFAGLIVGLMDPQFFDKAWTFDSEIAGVSIALSGPDGSADHAPPLRRRHGRLVRRRPRNAGAAVAGTRRRYAAQRRRPASRLPPGRRLPEPPDLRRPADDVVLAGWQQVAWIVGLRLAGGLAGARRTGRLAGAGTQGARRAGEPLSHAVQRHSAAGDRLGPADGAHPRLQRRGRAAIRPGDRARARCRTTSRSWPNGSRNSRRTSRR